MTRKTIKHAVYTLEEKEEIVKEYLGGNIGQNAILRKYDICDGSVLRRWIKMYRAHGKLIDRRGKSGQTNKGRPKKIKPNQMSYVELVHYVELNEDIKKSITLLRKQKTNIG